MTYNRTSRVYQRTAVLSTSREQLVPLLYEHLLVSLRQASNALAAGDMERKTASVEKATSILYELLGSLDFEAEGELASRLASLYTYFLKELGEASRSLKGARLAPLIEMVSTLYESWAEAARLVASGSEGDEAGAGP